MYKIPKKITRSTIVILKSKFITSIAYAEDTTSARELISDIREKMPDANHHVYAFRIGYGSTIIEGMSDDGEPSGTAGPPTLSVLRGTDVGDIVAVTTRYFGGTKLGTGGLVRAYTASVQQAIQELEYEFKIERTRLKLNYHYKWYDKIKIACGDYDINLLEEDFSGSITTNVEIPTTELQTFTSTLNDLTSGQIKITSY